MLVCHIKSNSSVLQSISSTVIIRLPDITLSVSTMHCHKSPVTPKIFHIVPLPWTTEAQKPSDIPILPLRLKISTIDHLNAWTPRLLQTPNWACSLCVFVWLTRDTLSRRTSERHRHCWSSSQCCYWFSETKQFYRNFHHKSACHELKHTDRRPRWQYRWSLFKDIRYT